MVYAFSFQLLYLCSCFLTLKGGAESCRFVAADHTIESDCQRVVAETVRIYGRIDILFNNAGIVTRGTAEELDEAAWAATMAINVTAVWRMSRLVLPAMRACGSRASIINNASDAALVCAGYCWLWWSKGP